MKIAILGNRPNRSVDQLKQTAADRYQVDFVAWPELSAEVGRCPQTDRGRQFDRFLVRGMPGGSLEQVIFRMNSLACLESAGVPVVNAPRSLEISIDKFLSLELLDAAGVAVPRTVACQTVEVALAAFQQMGGDVVVKPLFGGEGRGIFRISDPDLAARSFQTLVSLHNVIYLQPFIDHGGTDVRLLVVGDDLFAMRRTHDSDWRVNASRGADCRALTPTPELQDLAMQAARATGSAIAGVDVVFDRDDRPLVLEVNGVPGWNRLQDCCGVNISERVLAAVVGAVPV